MAEFWVRQEKTVCMKAGREGESSKRMVRLKKSRYKQDHYQERVKPDNILDWLVAKDGKGGRGYKEDG